MNYQRYISNELTHFVGGIVRPDGSGLSDDDRIDLLVNKIISSRRLLGDPKNPQNPDLISRIGVRTDEKLALGELLFGTKVCFCDITEENLAIHKEKYGSFALALQERVSCEAGSLSCLLHKMSCVIG